MRNSISTSFPMNWKYTKYKTHLIADLINSQWQKILQYSFDIFIQYSFDECLNVYTCMWRPKNLTTEWKVSSLLIQENNDTYCKHKCIFFQIADLQLKIQNFEDNTVDKSAVGRLESKIRDLENKLDLEISQKHRLEVSLPKKDCCKFHLHIWYLHSLWTKQFTFILSMDFFCITSKTSLEITVITVIQHCADK